MSTQDLPEFAQAAVEAGEPHRLLAAIANEKEVINLADQLDLLAESLSQRANKCRTFGKQWPSDSCPHRLYAVEANILAWTADLMRQAARTSRGEPEDRSTEGFLRRLEGQEFSDYGDLRNMVCHLLDEKLLDENISISIDAWLKQLMRKHWIVQTDGGYYTIQDASKAAQPVTAGW